MQLNNDIHTLRSIALAFDPDSIARRKQLLRALPKQKLPKYQALITYTQTLLCISAHADSPETFTLAQVALLQLAKQLKRLPQRTKKQLENSGLPYSITLSTFSHDLLREMMHDTQYDVYFDAFSNSQLTLSETLAFTLPGIEKEITATGYANRQLLSALHLSRPQYLPFLISEFARLDHAPFIKDELFHKLGLYVKLKPKDHSFSKAFNRIHTDTYFYHRDLIRKFDHTQLLAQKLPAPTPLSAKKTEAMIRSMQQALILMQRETDPITYIDAKSLRYYNLDRGLSVAIYGMIPERQLAVESYVGYTLFKNGYPAAYGGAWVLGNRALFGVHIFEAFRGGESAYMFCSLLRVYTQVFQLSYIEVEPYQYGKDNPEGIASGAFWFYYKFGFRPVDATLRKLAQQEFARIKREKGYRSPTDTLLRFTESNIALNMAAHTPISMLDIRERTHARIAETYNGDRRAAEVDSIAQLKHLCAPALNGRSIPHKALSEVALLRATLHLQKSKQLQVLPKLLQTRSADLYAYQQYLRILLKGVV